MKVEKSFIRHGSVAVRPYLYGAPDLPEFLQHVFGAVEFQPPRVKMKGEDISPPYCTNGPKLFIEWQWQGHGFRPKVE
jgi:hypothetical protein